MLGFLRPTAGRAAVAGYDCWAESVQARRHVAYLPGELRLYENMTGRQLVRFLSQLRTSHMPDAQEDETYEKDLERLAGVFDIDVSRPIADLSSGMKRKVALLQVLLPRAPLLILDEPTNTLDPTMRDQLLEQIRDAGKQGQAVLFSSHVLSEVERVCDRVGILQRGRLVHVQNMAELREGRLVRARFERPVEAGPDLQGLRLRARFDNQLTWEYTGPLPPLLEWLARQPVVDLRLEPLGLAPIYQRYHGAEA